MNYPHRRYIDFLLLVVGATSAELRRVLLLDQLVVPDVSDLMRVHVELAARPTTFNPFGTDESSQIWLREHGISGLVRGDNTAREAFAILRSPVWRQPVELLLLAGIAPSGIINFLRNRGIATPSEDAITAFSNYFWAVGEMSLGDWQEFLLAHPEGSVLKEALIGGADVGMDLAGKVLSRLEARHVLGERAGPRPPETAWVHSDSERFAEEPMPPTSDAVEQNHPEPAPKPSRRRRAVRSKADVYPVRLEIPEFNPRKTPLPKD